MVIAHVISFDIVMTAWGVQNVTVNTVVRGKKEEEKIPSHHLECLFTSWEGCRQIPNTISVSGFPLETAWSSGGAKTNRRNCLSLHGGAAFSPPFLYFFCFLKDHSSQIPGREEVGDFSLLAWAVFVAGGVMQPRSSSWNLNPGSSSGYFRALPVRSAALMGRLPIPL